jgi:hypothetical protein
MDKKYYGVHDHPDLIRDPDSKAVLARDNEQLNKYKEEREFKLKLARVVEEHDRVKNDVSEIKDMLKAILGKI